MVSSKSIRYPITDHERTVLELLDRHSEMNGAELIEEGLKEGTVYTLLKRMEDKGWVHSRQEQREGAGVPFRYYSLSEDGEDVLHFCSDIDQLIEYDT